jgi:hypothetical protein
MEKDAWKLTEREGAVDLFFDKKEVAQKEEKKGHLTSEDNGQPNFKGRMMADPLIIGPVVFLGLKVSRLEPVVNDGWVWSGIKL